MIQYLSWGNFLFGSSIGLLVFARHNDKPQNRGIWPLGQQFFDVCDQTTTEFINLCVDSSYCDFTGIIETAKETTT